MRLQPYIKSENLLKIILLKNRNSFKKAPGGVFLHVIFKFMQEESSYASNINYRNGTGI